MTTLVWFRNDLRLHDHPALAAAAAQGAVVPVFVLDERILRGRHASPNRTRFLLECLHDLRRSLQARGSDLIIRSGRPAEVLRQLTDETQATAVYYTADYSPFATDRDQRLSEALEGGGLQITAYPGRLAIDQPADLATKAGKPHRVFTPFWRQWEATTRRPLATMPSQLTLPPGLQPGELPDVAALCGADELSPDVLSGGETAARQRLEAWLAGPIEHYEQHHNDLAADATSRLSADLHFGCLSVREIETMLPDGEGTAAWHRQLAWRDFYHYVLLKFSANAQFELQERYRDLAWEDNPEHLTAWQTGHTGYPVVDAAMRQLRAEGWMHNRARLIVGSFLTKDLGLDWRHGERHFMRWLIDGDEANNNGNWQWIGSVGVDPAPVFRRLYNPTKQQERFDPAGQYVRRYVPELAQVPAAYLAEPWRLSEADQTAIDCKIGRDYPAPVVDHAAARLVALERYRQAGVSD